MGGHNHWLVYMMNARPLLDTVAQILAIVSLCGIPIAATIFLTTRRCRYLLARNQHPSYGTMLLGACAMPLLLVLLASFMEPETWLMQDGKMTLDSLLTLLCFVAVVCILSALGAVMFCQNQQTGKHKEF